MEQNATVSPQSSWFRNVVAGVMMRSLVPHGQWGWYLFRAILLAALSTYLLVASVILVGTIPGLVLEAHALNEGLVSPEDVPSHLQFIEWYAEHGYQVLQWSILGAMMVFAVLLLFHVYVMVQEKKIAHVLKKLIATPSTHDS
jgi:Ni,Fe-hydrogenase I cytochrome b subunit